MSDVEVPEGVGDIAIVLHSHMPYVEGFGTYPFGEEWLFDAVVRSHLPVLERARDVTVTVTPVLADQLEDGGGRRADCWTSSASSGSARPNSTPATSSPRSRPPARPRPTGTGRTRGPGAPRRQPAEGILRRRRVGTGRADHVRCHPRRPAAPRDPSGAVAPGRDRTSLPHAAVRSFQRLLAAGVRLRAGPGVPPRRVRNRLLLHRPVGSRA